jgi:peptide N-acetyl-beta-D-glucosaminyl asparaginase amidase A
MARRSWPVLGLVVLLIALPLAGFAASPTAPLSPGVGTSPSGSSTPVAAPLAVPQTLRGLLEHNLTGPQTTPGAGPPPLSAYPDTPAPPLPTTSPTVVSVVTNGRGCCYYVNQTPAGGPWDAVVLNYTGTAVGGVYDSSYRAYVGGAQVLFGTTPEYGTWTVLDNITEYESLLAPGANFSFILSAALLGGYFETSVTLSFYPPPAGAPVPSEPSKILPVWSHQFVTPSTTTISANVTVPSDASAATLEMWAYGFQADEFWWAAAHPNRAVSLAVDGTPFGAVLPFPYINTGGVNLFLWRPIPGAYTLNDRPYETNVSGALGLLSGAHTYTATIPGRDPASDWLVEGSLLIWTNPNVTSATSTGGNASLSGPMISGTTTSLTSSFAWTSQLAIGADTRFLSSSGSGTFSETEATVSAVTNGTSWENVTQSSTMTDRTSARDLNGSTWANATRSFQLGAHLGSRFVETSNTGGGYPITGNFTTSLLDVEQQWTEQSGIRSVDATGGWTSLRATVDNEITGGNSIWGGVETLTSATASPNILANTFVQAETPKYTATTATGSYGTASSSHVIVGSSWQPTDPNGAETILENRYDTQPTPLVAVVAATPNPVDIGGTLTLAATVHGGAGVYSYGWTGLPFGCTSANSSRLLCIPAGAGPLTLGLTVTDALGDVLNAPVGAVLVVPALSANVTASSRGADVGGLLTFSVSLGGGVAPYTCQWSLTGRLPTTQSCQLPVHAPTVVAGQLTASVMVTDGTGVNTTSLPRTVTVNGPLIVSLQAANPNATFRVGSPANFLLGVTGGTAPFTVTWFSGSAIVNGVNGTNVTIVPNATGSLVLSALVTDGTGASAQSTILTVTVVAPATGTGSAGGGSSNSGLDATFWVAVALAGVAVVEAVLLIGRPRPPWKRKR